MGKVFGTLSSCSGKTPISPSSAALYALKEGYTYEVQITSNGPVREGSSPNCLDVKYAEFKKAFEDLGGEATLTYLSAQENGTSVVQFKYLKKPATGTPLTLAGVGMGFITFFAPCIAAVFDISTIYEMQCGFNLADPKILALIGSGVILVAVLAYAGYTLAKKGGSKTQGQTTTAYARWG